MSRPILPVPILSASLSPGRESSTPAGSGGSQPPGEQPKRQYAKRGAISKVACRSCRRRKTKCNSERPSCQNCLSRSEPCIYDYDESDRSLTFLRDNAENLAQERDALESVLQALQKGSEESALEVFRRLRAGGNLLTLSQQVQASRSLTEVGSSRPLSSPNSMLSRLDQHEQLTRAIVRASPAEVDEIIRRLREKTEPGSILSAIRAKSLVQPLNNEQQSLPALEKQYSGREQNYGLVRGTGSPSLMHREQSDFSGQGSSQQPWTLVTHDAEFIEHLFLLYFSWQHSFFQNFPEDLFRADYSSGRTRYCSAPLVNAICACGCLLSGRPECRRDPENYTTSGLDFYHAARSELSAQPGSSFCTVAALSLMAHFQGSHGRISSSWLLCGQSGRMAIDLSLHLRDKVWEGSAADPVRQDDQARLHAFWGTFISDQISSFTLGRVPQIPINCVTRSLPAVDPALDEVPWIAYNDHSAGISPGAISTTFREIVSLCIVVNSTLLLFFSPAKVISGGLLLDEYEKYIRWKNNLPRVVFVHEKPPPHVICLHMLWHSAVLMLFRPFLRAKINGSGVVPQDICRQSANSISELFAKHRSSYGLSGIWTFQIQCLLAACTIHIIHLPAIASTSYFIDACISLHDLVGRNEWAKSGLEIVKGLVRKWERVLPGDAEDALYRDDQTDRVPPSLSRIGSNVQRAALGNRDATSSRSTPLEMAEKRSSSSSTAPAFSMPKKPRLEQLESLPELFAPSDSQPAPLLGPIHLAAALEKVRDFAGLDFSAGDDWLNPFMGFVGVA